MSADVELSAVVETLRTGGPQSAADLPREPDSIANVEEFAPGRYLGHGVTSIYYLPAVHDAREVAKRYLLVNDWMFDEFDRETLAAVLATDRTVTVYDAGSAVADAHQERESERDAL